MSWAGDDANAQADAPMRRLLSCYFAAPPGRGVRAGDDTWKRLAGVLRFSAARHCLGWSVEVVEIQSPVHSRLTYHYVANTHKLDYWTEAVLSASPNDEIVLVDADTMVLRNLDEAWSRSFDLAYTRKDSPNPAHLPLNAGVIFLRVSPKVKRFMSVWRDANHRMLEDPNHHGPWARKYGGINQSALGMLLETGRVELDLAELQCQEWNCEDSSWGRYEPGRTRIVHVKSALRRSVLDPRVSALRLRHLANLWRQFEREAAA